MPGARLHFLQVFRTQNVSHDRTIKNQMGPDQVNELATKQDILFLSVASNDDVSGVLHLHIDNKNRTDVQGVA